ncbi:MAG: serine/threonine protein kinase, partial [Deltaproteobacteria bacterium]
MPATVPCCRPRPRCISTASIAACSAARAMGCTHSTATATTVAGTTRSSCSPAPIRGSGTTTSRRPRRHRRSDVDRLAGYAIEAVLGRGGFGVVVRARGSDGRVAIKLAHPHREARDRLARERDVLAAVGPPLAPALLGHGASDDGSPFLVMELVDAPTLRAPEVRARGVAALARPLVVAVAALHARGFVHRDLKPENVFVMPDRVVLVDFGLARRTGDGDRTRTGAVAGTALYAAPEQLAGAAVTPAS